MTEHRLTQKFDWPHTEQAWTFHVVQGQLVIVNETLVGKGEANARMEHTIEVAGTKKYVLSLPI